MKFLLSWKKTSHSALTNTRIPSSTLNKLLRPLLHFNQQPLDRKVAIKTNERTHSSSAWAEVQRLFAKLHKGLN